MFGKNERLGPGYFAQQPEAREGKLLVTSIFFTIQGEGPYSGLPAMFIRLTHCNLACSFCDTDFSRGDWMGIEDIDRAIHAELERVFAGAVPDIYRLKYPDFQRKMVLVITGGEPSLQGNLLELVGSFEQDYQHVQIESHGLLVPNVTDATTVVVSPKCAERDGKPFKYLNPNPRTLERADCLKFVVEDDPSSPYYTVPDWAHAWASDTRKPVFISPMNRYLREPQQAKEARVKNSSDLVERSTVEEVISFWTPGLLDMQANQRNHEYSSDYAMRNGFRWQMQQHLYAGKA